MLIDPGFAHKAHNATFSKTLVAESKNRLDGEIKLAHSANVGVVM
jgi:hypothetical protein